MDARLSSATSTMGVAPSPPAIHGTTRMAPAIPEPVASPWKLQK